MKSEVRRKFFGSSKSHQNLSFWTGALLCLKLIGGVSGQTIGDDLCACSPPVYNITFDFSLTCPPVNVAQHGLASSSCLIGPFGDPTTTDLAPVLINEITIDEIGQDASILVQRRFDEGFVNGDTLLYESVTNNPDRLQNPNQIPRAIRTSIIATNAIGQQIISVFILTYTNSCSTYPVIRLGDSIGWAVFQTLNAPTLNLCPASLSGPDTVSPVASSTASPTAVPTTTPIVTPTFAPTGSPTATPQTVSPIASPTNSPSQSPSSAPSNTPTVPAVDESSSPSGSPSETPQTAPPTDVVSTPAPSQNPTTPETSNPSTSPSLSPTRIPTIPSSMPSTSPSQTPTQSPTLRPTQPMFSSASPTIPSPSVDPTQSPSFEPSQAPSKSPSTTSLAPQVVTGIPSSLLPVSEPSTDCYTSTSAILQAQLQSPPVRDIEICPGTIIDIGIPTDWGPGTFVNGDIPLTVVLDDVTIRCGRDGSSSNSCILMGGHTQVSIVSKGPPFYKAVEVNNLWIEGLTFMGNLADLPGLPNRAIEIGAPSNNITLVDCLFDQLEADQAIVVTRDSLTDPEDYTPFSTNIVVKDCTFSGVTYGSSVILNDQQIMTISGVEFRNLRHNNCQCQMPTIINNIDGRMTMTDSAFSDTEIVTSIVSWSVSSFTSSLSLSGNTKSNITVFDKDSRDASDYCEAGVIVDGDTSDLSGNTCFDLATLNGPLSASPRLPIRPVFPIGQHPPSESESEDESDSSKSSKKSSRRSSPSGRSRSRSH